MTNKLTELTKQDFIVAGYREYSTSFRGADYLLQKKVIDDVGIKYFVDVFVYLNSNKPWYRQGCDKPISFQPGVQFQKAKFEVMNVTLLLNSLANIQKIEDTFETLWNTVGMPYYEIR